MEEKVYKVEGRGGDKMLYCIINWDDTLGFQDLSILCYKNGNPMIFSDEKSAEEYAESANGETRIVKLAGGE